jgi:ATP-dependent Clp protease ATP-binding subunit ClpX
VQGTSIGFSATVKAEDTDLAQTTPDDIVKFGMIPEFVGRFPTWVALQQLDKQDLIRILIDIKNSYISQYKWLFDQDKIKLEFTNDALEQIADNTIANKTGARGLHSELERVLLPHMYRLPEYQRLKIDHVIIDKNMVNTPMELKQVNGQ